MRVVIQTIYPLLLFSNGDKTLEYSIHYREEAQPTMYDIHVNLA